MKLFYINTFFSVLSVILYFIAPNNYSYNFCALISVLFLFQNILFFKYRRDRNIVGFEFFFMIAFGLTNFIYPIIYFLNDPTLSMFSLEFNSNIISKATSLAFLAYSFYLWGLSYFEIRYNEKIHIVDDNKVDFIRISRIIHRITLLFLMLFILSGGIVMLSNEYSGVGTGKGIYAYFYMFLFVSSVLLTIFMFREGITKRNRMIYVGTIILIVLLLLATGSRTLPLALLLTSLVAYNNYRKKISVISFLSLIAAGAFFLTIIMFTRNISISSSNYLGNVKENIQFHSIWDIGSDLIINNRNLYTLVDYTNNHGYTYGITMLNGILSPIPFMQGLICNIFSIQKDFIGSATLNTYLALGEDSSWGLGTNMVSDVYLAFGLFGVICLFFILGFILAKSKAQLNIYWDVLYYIFISNSIYWVRSGYFDDFRYIIWGLIIVSLVKHKYVIKKSL